MAAHNHRLYASLRGAGGNGSIKDVPAPGPIAIVTDGKTLAGAAPQFKDAILSRVPHADVRMDINVEQLASRAAQEGIVGVVWVSFAPTGLLEAIEAPGSKIRWVQLPSAGIEKHDAVIRAHPELIWTTAKGAFAEPVAEHGLALTLSLLRFVPARVVATSWGLQAGISLFRSNVVILGAGGISLAYVSLLAPFHCTAHLVRRNASDPLDLPPNVDPASVQVHGFSGLDALLPSADVLFLACALTEETRGLLNERTIALLPKHCVVVNVGRGGLIVTDALVDALRRGSIAGAGLDVTDPEPLPEGHALYSLTTEASHDDGDEERRRESVLGRQRANVIITPHTADTAEMARPLITARAGANAAALYEQSGRFEGLIRIDGDHIY